MMETMLTSRQVADLYGKDERTIRRWVQSGKLSGEAILNEFNSTEYRFSVAALDPPYQQKYYDQLKASLPAVSIPARAASASKNRKALDTFTADEREEIVWWRARVKEWQGYRQRASTGAKRAKVDEKYIALFRLQYPDTPISTDILYRKWRAVREDDDEALVDKRGKHRKGKSSIPEPVWQAFLYYYLDENQHPVRKCYEYAKLWTQQAQPELMADIPCYTTFYRHVQSDVPMPVKVLGREGDKAFKDRCSAYISRVYDDMASNEFWIADNHTFDIITQGENGQRHRLYLTAFMDARSGILTGFHITENPCSQATLIALRKGILQYGIPDNIYTDNGREFLTFDIGGLGHRKKKPKDGQEVFSPPPVFERLGIKMTNAIVRNAKAKTIERRFLDFKNQISRLFETFTGGNVVEKPEKLKTVLKNGQIPVDGNFIPAMEELLEGYFNESPYGGYVTADRGKPKMQVYQEHLHKKRIAPEADLNLMLMRSSHKQKVGRLGVHLDIAGYRIDFWNDDFKMQMMGKEVYYRYDPDDLSEVRVYDLEDRFICTVPARTDTVCSYNDSVETVKDAVHKTRSLQKKAKETLDASILPFVSRRTALELVMASAHEGRMARLAEPAPDAKIIEIRRVEEEPLLRAVGDTTPDLDRMTRNARNRDGGNDDE